MLWGGGLVGCLWVGDRGGEEGAYLSNACLPQCRRGRFANATAGDGLRAGGGAVVHLALLLDARGGERGGLSELLAFGADHRGGCSGDVGARLGGCELWRLVWSRPSDKDEAIKDKPASYFG